MQIPLQHSLHDERKLALVRHAKQSATFSQETLSAVNKLAGVIGQDGAEVVRDAFLMHVYDGGRPLFAGDDAAANVCREIIECVHQSTHLKPQRKMAQHNIWSADVVAALAFRKIIEGLTPDALEQLAQTPQDAGDTDAGEEPEEKTEGGSQEEQADEQPQSEDDGDVDDGGDDHESAPAEDDEGGDDDHGDDDGVGDGDPPEEEGAGEGSCDEGGEKPDDGDVSEGGEDADSDCGDGLGDDELHGDPLDGDATDGAGQSDVAEMIEAALADAEVEAVEGGVSGTDGVHDQLAQWEGTQEEMPESPFFGSTYGNAKKIAERMGRIQNVLTAAMADRVHYQSSTPIKVTFGNDIRNAMKHQLVHMGEPTEVILQKQIMSRELMQRETMGIGRAGAGPIIMCIDVSSSMTHGGTMLADWAMALAGAIGWAAAKRRREVAYIYYSNLIPDILHVPSKLRRDVHSLDRAIGTIVNNPWIGSGYPHPLSLIPTLIEKEIMRNDWGYDNKEKRLNPRNPRYWGVSMKGGGTNYAGALEAVRCVMQSQRMWRSADVLFLSDGNDSFASAATTTLDGNRKTGLTGHLAEMLRKEHGCRIYGICLVPEERWTPSGYSEGEDMERRRDSIRAGFEPSMGDFDNYVIAPVGEESDANEVLYEIGLGL